MTDAFPLGRQYPFQGSRIIEDRTLHRTLHGQTFGYPIRTGRGARAPAVTSLSRKRHARATSGQGLRWHHSAMFGALWRFFAYRLVGGRLLLILTILGWLRSLITGRRRRAAERSAFSAAARSEAGANEPS
jgi:hypothetical protein